MTGFELPVRPGLALVLAEVRLADAYHALITSNSARLAQWERWAEFPSSLTHTQGWLASRMSAFAQGRAVPTLIVADGEPVGSCGAEIDAYAGTASVGFWIDADAEGRGLVTASTRRLLQHVVTAYPVARCELRTSVDNLRSRAVAERLGFRLDGVLRAALPRRQTRVDACVYSLLAGGSRLTQPGEQSRSGIPSTQKPGRCNRGDGSVTPRR